MRFAELTDTKVRALDPALRLGDEGLAHGDVITVGGLELRVVPTPGHTADSLCFHLPADRAVLTGDTILGRGTTVVAHPDGRLGDYLDSLRRLRSLTVDDGVHTVLPGHGPVLEDAQGAVEFYLAHRAHRLAQVETAVENGYRSCGRGRRARVRGRGPFAVARRGTVRTGADGLPAGTRPHLGPVPDGRTVWSPLGSYPRGRLDPLAPTRQVCGRVLVQEGRQEGRTEAGDEPARPAQVVRLQVAQRPCTADQERPDPVDHPRELLGEPRQRRRGPAQAGGTPSSYGRRTAKTPRLRRRVSASASRASPRPAGSPRGPRGGASRGPRSRRAPC